MKDSALQQLERAIIEGSATLEETRGYIEKKQRLGEMQTAVSMAINAVVKAELNLLDKGDIPYSYIIKGYGKNDLLPFLLAQTIVGIRFSRTEIMDISEEHARLIRRVNLYRSSPGSLDQLSVFSSLEEMHVPIDLLKEALQATTGHSEVRSLTIGSSEGTGPDILDSALTDLKYPNLETISTLGDISHSVSAEALEQIGKHTKLKSMPFGVSDNTLPLIKNLTNLESLNLSFSEHQVSDEGLKIIAETFPKLRKLELSDSHSITPKGIRHLSKLRDLRYLDLSYCNLITPEVVDALIAFPSLRHLRINRDRRSQVFLEDLLRLREAKPELKIESHSTDEELHNDPQNRDVWATFERETP